MNNMTLNHFIVISYNSITYKHLLIGISLSKRNMNLFCV